MRLIDADKIIFREIDEIGGEYEPYLGCSKSQIYSLPTVEAIPKADYENRLKADMVAMLKELEVELYEKQYNYNNRWVVNHRDISKLINEKINALKGEKNE